MGRGKKEARIIVLASKRNMADEKYRRRTVH
jgi:hypothetical protein